MKLENFARVQDLLRERDALLNNGRELLGIGEPYISNTDRCRDPFGKRESLSLQITGPRIEQLRAVIKAEIEGRIAEIESELRRLGLEFEPARLELKPKAAKAA